MSLRRLQFVCLNSGGNIYPDVYFLFVQYCVLPRACAAHADSINHAAGDVTGGQYVSGFHAVVARLRHAPASIKTLYVDVARRDKRMQTFVAQAQAAGVQPKFVAADRLDSLSKGLRHQGVIALAVAQPLATDIDACLDAVEQAGRTPLLLVLDGVTDPHNLGACLRTADAAGVHAVIAPRDRAVGLTNVVRRVACGAAETMPYFMVTNLARTLRHLKARDLWVIGTDDQASASLHQADLRRATAWVVGAEGAGMRRLTRETCDELVRIPMQGCVESLNVSVASAVCLYEAVRQRGDAG